MTWAGLVACMAKVRNAYTILVVKPEGKSHLKDLGVDGSIILKWIFGKKGWRVWIEFSWLMIGTGGGFL
jgi:hypothetical protein